MITNDYFLFLLHYKCCQFPLTKFKRLKKVHNHSIKCTQSVNVCLKGIIIWITLNHNGSFNHSFHYMWFWATECHSPYYFSIKRPIMKGHFSLNAILTSARRSISGGSGEKRLVISEQYRPLLAGGRPTPCCHPGLWDQVLWEGTKHQHTHNIVYITVAQNGHPYTKGSPQNKLATIVYHGANTITQSSS